MPNKATLATRERIEREADPIGFLARVMQGELIEAAPVKEGEATHKVYPTLDQRLSAARVLADKQIPNAKSRAVSLALPRVETADDVAKAQAVVIAAMGTGEITPDEAATISGVLESKRRAIETVDLEKRITRLEQEKERTT